MSRSNLKKVLFLAVVCVLIAVGIMLASNWHAVAALYRPTPAVKQVQLNYSNRIYGFSLKFPQFWADSEPNTLYGEDDYIVKFTSPEIEGCDIPITVSIVAEDLPKETPDETVDESIIQIETGLKSSANNYRRVSLTDATVSGLPAKVLRWTMGDNEDLTSDWAVFINDGKVFIVAYSALTEFHGEAYQGFELVINSLKFKQSIAPAVSPSATP